MRKNFRGLLLFAIFLAATICAAQQPPAESKKELPAKPAPQENKPQAADASEQERERRFREMVMRPVVYKLAGMEQARVISNLNYTGTESPYRKMDVYVPAGVARNERLPAVVFLHGGAAERFTPKDWGIYTSWGRLIAASRMVGVTFTHRLGFPKTLLTEGASDVNDAINYIRANADSLNIDKDRMCLIAFSAGGPLLSTAMREKPSYVRCLVAFYAFMDVQQSEFHRASETPETVKMFSNITHLADGDASLIAPLFIARAGRDEIPTMNDSIDRFIREAISKNAAITVMNHPQGVHGFDNSNDDARSREIIQAAIAFMKLHLGVK
ncbi:MAG TPA: alpha/beta hydrolase [Pyrinomonadaceae bacterium]